MKTYGSSFHGWCDLLAATGGIAGGTACLFAAIDALCGASGSAWYVHTLRGILLLAVAAICSIRLAALRRPLPPQSHAE